ncbi:hypothetical protein AVEN_76477-1 [Araneus ventricosus]|uniref:Uncharacterized protein n=1 Tax=Araneus ventricosus TaxID=182803 RepID=A0A4Y2CGG9_ARAVE|nr:hypothetical protein AVEN_76477-1 [Araneus ventricosus]
MLSDGVILLHDKTHTARKAQEWLRKFHWEDWGHPLYSPDPARNRDSKHLSRTSYFYELRDFFPSKLPGGRGGLVVRSRLWGRRVPGSKPDSTEDPPCMGPVAR